ncbi:solute carrier family 15 member 5 [Platysternon megacephalum]|uniref:Solute carrier family 15 member 5 n=1 Tax=Platysternon megacephalum TaxID=55544 RepID=A0A4D9E9U7_9SAUR|nr:solute carrier family 15 member 5 [Platysternon megacephalum]
MPEGELFKRRQNRLKECSMIMLKDRRGSQSHPESNKHPASVYLYFRFRNAVRHFYSRRMRPSVMTEDSEIQSQCAKVHASNHLQTAKLMAGAVAHINEAINIQSNIQRETEHLAPHKTPPLCTSFWKSREG